MFNYKLVACDTDSIKFQKQDGSPISKKEQEEIIEYLNSITPELIKLEEDGYYDKILVVKTKNYVTVKGDKVTIMGSALKASMKEPALKQFINDLIDDLLYGRDILSRYNSYAKQIKYLDKIDAWCSKKTITKSILNPSRTNEQKILDAINGRHVSEGDKIKVFFKSDESVGLLEDFDGDFHKGKLYEKLFKTAKIFEQVIDVDKIPNYKLKRNKEKEAQL